jgi:hypothetical protein
MTPLTNQRRSLARAAYGKALYEIYDHAPARQAYRGILRLERIA